MAVDIVVSGKEHDIVEVYHWQGEKDPGDDVLLRRIRYRTRDGRSGEFRITEPAAEQLLGMLSKIG